MERACWGRRGLSGAVLWAVLFASPAFAQVEGEEEGAPVEGQEGAEGTAGDIDEAAPEEAAPGDIGAEAPMDEEASEGEALEQDVGEEVVDDSVSDSGGKIFDTRIYGYIDAYWEKVANTPAGVDASGKTITEGNPHEFDVANFHVMVQGSILNRFRYFLNLAAPGAGSSTDDEGLSVRNAWVEAPIFGDYLNIRFGKTYRSFGLYNEVLDAVPTFIGIEPPELFDKDHLMLTRTTNLMLHGKVATGDHTVSYSVATGNDERASDEVPIGADAHYDFQDKLRVGTSFYWTGGDAVPSRGVGDGSPRGGVINWMDQDEFVVFGGYLELHLEGLTLQTAYWQAEHNATRDPASVAGLIGNLNSRQLDRMFTDPANPADTNVIAEADYTIRTAYLRAGYEFHLGEESTMTPYLQIDFYDNPETVASKSLGGDAEAGLADNGKFFKPTVGMVFRPVTPVALKIDGSMHVQEFNDETFVYPEVRASLSYLWGLEL